MTRVDPRLARPLTHDHYQFLLVHAAPQDSVTRIGPYEMMEILPQFPTSCLRCLSPCRNAAYFQVEGLSSFAGYCTGHTSSDASLDRRDAAMGPQGLTVSVPVSLPCLRVIYSYFLIEWVEIAPLFVFFSLYLSSIIPGFTDRFLADLVAALSTLRCSIPPVHSD